MATSKHTPAPWKLADGRTIETADGDFYLAYGTQAATGAPRWRGGFDVLDANARIVAVAPELIAILRRAESEVWGDCETVQNWMDDVRAVLTKAGCVA